MLIAYAHVGPPRTLRVWVGILDNAHPPVPTLVDVGGQGTAKVVAPLSAIRDGIADAAGLPLNHRAVLQLEGLQPDTSYRVRVGAGTESRELTLSTLPEALPQKLDGNFNILLCSCYSQPEDASGLLGSVVSQIMIRPQLTFMLGDQIYGDLPIFEDLPEDPVGVAQKLGRKYLPQLGLDRARVGRPRPGAEPRADRLRRRRPRVLEQLSCAQTQLPLTWTEKGRTDLGNRGEAALRGLRAGRPGRRRAAHRHRAAPDADGRHAQPPRRRVRSAVPRHDGGCDRGVGSRSP
jgi:hypothetical protein